MLPTPLKPSEPGLRENVIQSIIPNAVVIWLIELPASTNKEISLPNLLPSLSVCDLFRLTPQQMFVCNRKGKLSYLLIIPPSQ